MYLFLPSREIMQITVVFFFWQCVWLYWDFTLYWRVKLISWGLNSRVAQWKHAGPITQRSVDRNHALLNLFRFFIIAHIPYFIINIFFCICYFNMCIYFCQAERLYANYSCLLFLKNVYDYIEILHYIWEWKLIMCSLNSRVAQWKCAGPIIQMSVDRNHALLNLFRFFIIAHIPYFIINIFFCICYFNMCIYFCQAERLYANYSSLLFFDKFIWLYSDITLYWEVETE